MLLAAIKKLFIQPIVDVPHKNLKSCCVCVCISIYLGNRVRDLIYKIYKTAARLTQLHRESCYTSRSSTPPDPCYGQFHHPLYVLKISFKPQFPLHFFTPIFHFFLWRLLDWCRYPCSRCLESMDTSTPPQCTARNVSFRPLDKSVRVPLISVHNSEREAPIMIVVNTKLEATRLNLTFSNESCGIL